MSDIRNECQLECMCKDENKLICDDDYCIRYKAYKKGRTDERAKIIDLIDRHLWNYSKEVWEDFQPILKQLKEQK